MMWLIPRSDPGARTEYRRPHAGAVSVERGERLPYGPFPRLVMLWMYAADCAHARQVPPDQRNPVSSIYDFLVALGIETMVEVAALFEQADRLFACRFRAGERVMPVIEESVLQKGPRHHRAHVRSPIASRHGTRLRRHVPPGDGRAALRAMHAHPARAAPLPLRARRLSVGRVLRRARARGRRRRARA